MGLLLAAYLNMNAGLYYELFSSYMGKGDKESFAHALRAVNLSYHVVATPVGSLGTHRTYCNRSQRKCWQEFTGARQLQCCACM